MHIQLSDHFTFGKLLRFTLPSIAMMIFTSIYSVVDGLFVSNFVGKTPFAALNLIYPALGALSAIGFMLGTGGSAMVAKTLGEGDRPRANRYFSLYVYALLAVGTVAAVLGFVFMRPIAVLLGADASLLEHCVVYGRINLVAMPFFMLQVSFQSFFVTAEKPNLGFGMTVAAGLTNILLDALFVAVFQWGLAGAAWATAISQMVGGIVPLVYFARPNSSLLRLGRTRVERRPLVIACLNGSSEMTTNLSGSLVSMLYNARLMAMAGQNGVAAYGVIMYVNFVFIALFLGYSIGVAPVVGFNYGAGDRAELKNLLRKSLVVVLITSVGLTALSLLTATPLSRIVVGYDP
ncbi:MAG: polysaccharide biosynthesis C-terminal domain-containing protein, partial [Oscillospiraceae bacterium]|nr:polysaccharide biosynthesis C-terminal domain-containing protein [Oscillospiraceae bacterium]